MFVAGCRSRERTEGLGRCPGSGLSHLHLEVGGGEEGGKGGRGEGEGEGRREQRTGETV